MRIAATIVAILAALAFGAASASSNGPPAAATDSSCVECCEVDTVCQALAGLADLTGTVGELVPESGIENSLVAKLDAATSSVRALRLTPAVNQLDAFGHEVDALEKSGQISFSVSNILKTKHDTVKNSISNVR